MTLDKDGYPTRKTLSTIRKWNLSVELANYHKFMDYVRDIWKYADGNYWERDGNKYTLHTGGWSGNEDLIYAMQKNAMFWIQYWYSSTRGGHYVFMPMGEMI